jgi:hypothetical protein
LPRLSQADSSPWVCEFGESENSVGRNLMNLISAGICSGWLEALSILCFHTQVYTCLSLDGALTPSMQFPKVRAPRCPAAYLLGQVFPGRIAACHSGIRPWALRTALRSTACAQLRRSGNEKRYGEQDRGWKWKTSGVLKKWFLILHF